MEELDLNIHNYDLNDILNLFKLNVNFNASDLKQTYKMVLKTHPDKSNFPHEYFLFFSRAFKILKQIYDYREKRIKSLKRGEHCVLTGTYDPEKFDEKNRDAIVEKFLKRSDFNSWFNTMFERVKIKDECDEGYGDWLQSNENINTDVATRANMNSMIENKKRQLKELVVYEGIQDMDVQTCGGNVVSTLTEKHQKNMVVMYLVNFAMKTLEKHILKHLFLLHNRISIIANNIVV